MAEGTDYECPHPSLRAWGMPTLYVGPPCVLKTWGGGAGAHCSPPVLSSMTSDALRRGVKPVGTPVAIFGSLGVCIYGPAGRHWLISYSPIHLTQPHVMV